MVIGSLTNSHYQSLLPVTRRYQECQIKRTKAANPIFLTLTEKQNKVKSIKSIPNLNSRTEFPDLASESRKYTSNYIQVNKNFGKWKSTSSNTHTLIQRTPNENNKTDLKLNKPHDLKIGNTKIIKSKPENITTE